MSPDDVSRWLIRAAYLFGFALMFTAAFDLLSTVWPFRFGDLTWRYGFLGLGAGYLQSPAMGVVLLIGVGIWDRHPTMVRIAAVISLIAAVAIVGAMGVFALDALQVRPMTPPESQQSVLVGLVVQEIKYGIAALVYGLTGLGAMRTATKLDAQMGDGRPGIVAAAE